MKPGAAAFHQLPLFDRAFEATAPAAPVAPVPPVCAPVAAVWAAPETPLPPAGAAERHPSANREIQLGACRVAYWLRRARRKTIGFTVSRDGLEVSAPRWAGQGEIDAALRAKAAWIERKLVEQRERTRRVEAARVQWRDGASLPYLGETLIVVLDARIAGARLQRADDVLPGVPQLTLHVGLPQQAQPGQIRDQVQSWLRREALHLFEARCAHFAAQLGVRVQRLRLSSAQTRWGSAAADGSVWLNWRLIHFGLPVIDYVVAHELAHLREMNHSPAFWSVVRAVVPDYERQRGALHESVVPLLD